MCIGDRVHRGRIDVQECVTMKNGEVKVAGVITVDLSREFWESTSIASTEGDVSVPGREEITIGVTRR